MIYLATRNIRAIQILLGRTKIENIVRYLGVDVEDTLLLAKRTEIRSIERSAVDPSADRFETSATRGRTAEMGWEAALLSVRFACHLNRRKE